MRWWTGFAAFGLAAVAVGSVAQEQGAAPPVTRREVGDWTILCAGEGGPCVMEQVGKTAQGETALNVQIERLAEPQTVGGQRVTAVANILAPLGVVLPSGLRLQIDAGETAASPFFVCQQAGCLVRAPLQDQLLDSFRRGNRARFTYAGIDGGQSREVQVDISLSGFTRAYDELD
jgi:invasion protein IalB